MRSGLECKCSCEGSMNARNGTKDSVMCARFRESLFLRLEVVPGGRRADQVLVHRRKHAIERIRRELGLYGEDKHSGQRMSGHRE